MDNKHYSEIDNVAYCINHTIVLVLGRIWPGLCLTTCATCAVMFPCTACLAQWRSSASSGEFRRALISVYVL